MSLTTMPVSYCVGFPEPRRSSRSDQELLSDSVLVSRHGCARLVGTAACSSDDLHRTRLKCADLRHRSAATFGVAEG